MENSKYQEAFASQVSNMRGLGFDPYPQRLHIQIPDAREQLMTGIRYYMGDKAQWLPDYEQIADWLTDNKGRVTKWDLNISKSEATM